MKMKRYEDYTQEEIDNMSELQKNMLSQQKMVKELIERIPKIYSEPRDWGRPIEDPVIFGINEEPLKSITINSLTVKKSKNAVIIFGNFPERPEAMEIFTTREKINSFVDALRQTRDEAFPE
jgi:hypothetical protein